MERWPRHPADRSRRMCVSVKRVCLQPFHPQRDIDRVAAWLRAPQVVRWWGDPERHLHAVLKRPVEGGDALIVADGVTVGYVRWQRAPRAEMEAAGLHEIPEGSIDIDIAIGETDYIGCGVGSRALQLVVQRLRSEGSMPMIMMGTSVDNTMAFSAFERAGFRRSRHLDDAESDPAWPLVDQAPRPQKRYAMLQRPRGRSRPRETKGVACRRAIGIIHRSSPKRIRSEPRRAGRGEVAAGLPLCQDCRRDSSDGAFVRMGSTLARESFLAPPATGIPSRAAGQQCCRRASRGLEAHDADLGNKDSNLD